MISEYKQIIRRLTNHAALDLEAKQQTEEADVAAELIRKCVAEKAATPQDQEAYLERYRGLKARYKAATHRLKQIEDQRAERKQRRQKCWSLFGCWSMLMSCCGDLTKGLWNATVEAVTVKIDGGMMFRWKNGMETQFLTE